LRLTRARTAPAPRAHRYICRAQGCPGKGSTFLATHDGVMALLHPHIAQRFPALLPSRGAITYELLDRVFDASVKSNGFKDVSAKLRRKQAEEHARAEQEYLHAAAALASLPQVQVCVRMRACFCPAPRARARAATRNHARTHA
jgi:hypothetical protein